MILRYINAAVALAIFVWWASPCAAVPVASGLVLNFQANNIDGANNSTLVDGQELTQWRDIVVAGGDPNTNHANANGGLNYLDSGATTVGMPNFIAATTTGAPGVLFTRGATQAHADVLGNNSFIDGLNVNGGFTVIVTANISQSAPGRVLQFGHRGGNNHRIIGIGDEGFRYNGNAKSFSPGLAATSGPDIATYTMDLTQPVGGAGTGASYRINGSNGAWLSTNDPSRIYESTDTTGIVNNGFSIGAGQNNSSEVIDAINGILYSVMLYNRILSTAEIEQVETFLYNTYIAVPEAPAWVLCGVVLSGAGVVACVRKRRAAVCS